MISKIIQILKKLKALVSPDYYADIIGDKSGLYRKAQHSSLRQWALQLTGWKWWFYQIIVCGIFVILIELLLNLIGLTMLPWR